MVILVFWNFSEFSLNIIFVAHDYETTQWISHSLATDLSDVEILSP